jgi:signal transduction histidine kinase
VRPAILFTPRPNRLLAAGLGLLVAMVAWLGPGWPPLRAQEPPIATPLAAGTSAVIKRRPAVRLELDAANVILTGQFSDGTEAQEVHFSQPVSGRYFCLETLSAQDGRAYAAVAELDLLDRAGQPLPRTGWKIAYVDSEEQDREDGSAENALDGNPATYWHTQWSAASPNHPHHLVLDLGHSQTITGLRYLPRPGKGMVGGRIKDYRLYVGDGLLTENGADKALPDHCYLFGYFTTAGEPGLHLAYSLNGYRWVTLNGGHSLLTPLVGDKLFRDPCLVLGPDGVFHLVWTAAWAGNYIGYASSRDLVHWSGQTLMPVMVSQPGTLNCWAPEIFWDARQARYLVFWASSVRNHFGAHERSDHNRIYSTTTRDFLTLSAPQLYYDPGFSVVDATLLANQGRYYLFFKDDTVNHLRMAVANELAGPFGPASPTLGNDYAEGPMAFHLGDAVVAAYHIISANHCGAVKSTDLDHWEDISAGMLLPPGGEQGTVLEVTGKQLQPLQEAGLLETGTTPEASELGVGDWIWTTNVTDRQICHLWRAFDIPAAPPVTRATLRMTADNGYTVYLDGREIGRGGEANSLTEYDLTWLLSPGHHVLAVEAFNDTLDAGVLLGLRVQLSGGKKIEVFSGPNWRVAALADRNWRTRKTAPVEWPPAQVVGYAGKVWWQYPYKIITVPPLQPPVSHFWQQPWVLAALLLACLTVAVLWVRQGLRLALQKRTHRLLERERARIARDMHDELGSGLTQLTLLGELVLREAPAESASRQRLQELCTRGRSLLRSMDEIVWVVNPKRDTVNDFAAFISEHAQEYLALAAMRCRQEVMAELPAIPLDLPLRRNLLLAVKEAVRNAARHSGASEVNLQVQVVDNTLRVVVADNGRGFAPAETRAGRNGLANMQQRLADIGGICTLHSEPGHGCRITFLLPLANHETLRRP